MWNWIRLLFHQHKWKIIDSYWVNIHDGDPTRIKEKYKSLIMQCEHCGIIKQRNLN